MRIVFFVSSVGDTLLAKATMTKLRGKNLKDVMFIVPLTSTAVTHTADLAEIDQIYRISLDQIINQPNALDRKQISLEEIEHISQFIQENNIDRAYIGVPSVNNDIPFQIANNLAIPCTIAYEYMFKPQDHTMWNYIDELAAKDKCDFAVPLITAKDDILAKNSNAKVQEIGHLSIDRAQETNFINSQSVREALSVNTEKEFIFISGTTQPTKTDNTFLNALLGEIATGKYPHLQLRMGLHPGVSDADEYLQALIKTCENYPDTKAQFKIIITKQFKNKLKSTSLLNDFILEAEVAGAEAAQAADRVAQAVPGALLNEAALKGKPSYFHDQSAIPYLPREWFSNNLAAFFTDKSQRSHSREELGLKEPAPDALAKLMMG